MAIGNGSAQANSPDQISNLDQLSQLIMRLPRAGGSPLDSLAQAPAVQPRLAAANGQPVASAQPAPSAASAPASPSMGSTTDLESRVAQPRTQPAPPSDDPMVSYRGALDQSSKNLQDMIAQETATRGKISAVPAVNPADYKPHWYDRLLGGAVGALTGFKDPERGVEIGSGVTHRALNRAQASRQATLQPLMEQLNAEREEVPLLTEAQRSASEQLRGATEEGRLNEQTRRDTDLARYHDDIASIREEMTKGNIDKANNLLDQKQKELNEKSEVNKNTLDYRNGLLDLRQQMLDLKEKQGDKAKPQQFLGVQNKRDAAWAKARREYNSELDKLGLKNIDPSKFSDGDQKGMQEARENYYEKLQDAQDEFEQGIGTLGGSAEHVDLERNHFGEQAAPSSTPPAGKPYATSNPATSTLNPDAMSALKAAAAKGKGIRVKRGDAIEVWKLDAKGAPTLVNTETPK